MPDEVTSEQARSTMKCGNVLPCVVYALITGVAAVAADKGIDFRADIAPLLVARCQACHDARNTKGDVRVDTPAQILLTVVQPGHIVPGKPDESRFLEILAPEASDDERMPKDRPALTAGERDIFRRWIAAGSSLDGLDATASANVPLSELMAPPRYPPAPSTYRAPGAITALAFSPDGRELYASGLREITVWDPQSGKLLRRIGDVPPRTTAIGLLDSGAKLIIAGGTPGERGEVRVFDRATGRLDRTAVSSADIFTDMAISPAASLVAAASSDATLRLIDAKDWTVSNLGVHGDAVLGCRFSADGTKLAVVTRDKGAKVFDVKTGETTVSFLGHKDIAPCVAAFTVDGKQIVTGGVNEPLRFWRLDAPARSLELPHDAIRAVVSNERFFVASSDGVVREFSLVDRGMKHAFPAVNGWIESLAFHEPSQRLAAGCFDGRVFVWNVVDRQQLAEFVASPTP